MSFKNISVLLILFL